MKLKHFSSPLPPTPFVFVLVLIFCIICLAYKNKSVLSNINYFVNKISVFCEKWTCLGIVDGYCSLHDRLWNRAEQKRWNLFIIFIFGLQERKSPCNFLSVFLESAVNWITDSKQCTSCILSIWFKALTTVHATQFWLVLVRRIRTHFGKRTKNP